MGHNFDEARAERLKKTRTFTLGGESFSYRAAVAPEAYLEWSRMVGGEYGDELTEELSLQIFDDTIIAFLEDDQVEKWRKVRAKDADLPVTLQDMKEVVQYLFGENSGRPTGPSSDSSGGSRTEKTTTSSTVASSSQEAPA